ncbi:hypothetical protein ACH419_31220 [Streptomyces bobili]
MLDSLSTRRGRFKEIMQDLSLEEGEWAQLQDYDDHEDCTTAQT